MFPGCRCIRWYRRPNRLSLNRKQNPDGNGLLPPIAEWIVRTELPPVCRIFLRGLYILLPWRASRVGVRSIPKQVHATDTPAAQFLECERPQALMPRVAVGDVVYLSPASRGSGLWRQEGPLATVSVSTPGLWLPVGRSVLEELLLLHQRSKSLLGRGASSRTAPVRGRRRRSRGGGAGHSKPKTQTSRKTGTL